MPKTVDYQMARYRNSVAPAIPPRVLERTTSAELRADQNDQDCLPSLVVRDGSLEKFVEEDRTPDEIVAAGFERATVERVVAMVNRSEYTRRQAPPGVRVTRRAFGRGRRYPITDGFRK